VKARKGKVIDGGRPEAALGGWQLLGASLARLKDARSLVASS
jgi:hypothetical protein